MEYTIEEQTLEQHDEKLGPKDLGDKNVEIVAGKVDKSYHFRVHPYSIIPTNASINFSTAPGTQAAANCTNSAARGLSTAAGPQYFAAPDRSLNIPAPDSIDNLTIQSSAISS